MAAPRPPRATTLVQLGDLHLGADAAVEGWCSALLQWLDANEHDAVVVVGDLTEDGTDEQLTRAWELLDQLAERSARLSFCLGNHDVELAVPAIAERHRDAYLRTLELDGVSIVVAESSRVGERNGALELDVLDARLRAARSTCRVVAAHHNLLPAPGTLFQHEVMVGAGDVLGVLAAHDVALWLSGHKHQSRAVRLDDLVLATSGSPRRSRSRPTPPTPEVNVVSIDERELRVDAIEPVAGTRRTLLQTARSNR